MQCQKQKRCREAECSVRSRRDEGKDGEENIAHKDGEDEVDEGGLSGAMIDCRNSNMPDSSVFVIEEECIEEEAC